LQAKRKNASRITGETTTGLIEFTKEAKKEIKEVAEK
jgi:hypothetical protein